MKAPYAPIATIVLALGAEAVHASREGILRMDSFRLSSAGIGESGPVTVSGNQDDNGISSLTIEAFGKHLSLDGEQLTKIHGFIANGLQMSYERGHKELGGRTLYIVLSKGFTSGAVDRKWVVVTESGTIEISDEP